MAVFSGSEFLKCSVENFKNTNVYSRIFFVVRRQPDKGQRDRQFVITLVVLVFIFIFCQSGKIIVNLHDLFTIDTLAACQEISTRLGAPTWEIVMTAVARLLLLVNR